MSRSALFSAYPLPLAPGQHPDLFNTIAQTRTSGARMTIITYNAKPINFSCFEQPSEDRCALIASVRIVSASGCYAGGVTKDDW